MDPLAQLKDIHLPDPVGIWPLAPGWWISAILLLSASVATVMFIRKWRQRRRARAQAMAELKSLSASSNDWPVQLNALLKRAALSYFPHHRVASLHGEAWADFLTRQVPAKHADRVRRVLGQLHRAVYDPKTPAPEFSEALSASRTWLTTALPPKSDRIGEESNV